MLMLVLVPQENAPGRAYTLHRMHSAFDVINGSQIAHAESKFLYFLCSKSQPFSKLLNFHKKA
jgi:hypothetical protein